jgi:hypothetical protein
MAERLIAWVVPVAPCSLARVRDALAQIGASPAANPLLPFGSAPAIHFASATLFDDDPEQPATLVLEVNSDDPLDRCLETLVNVGRRGLDALFVCADGYPGVSEPDDRVVDYLKRRRKTPQLYHLGHPNRSLDAIRGDLELRRSIEHELRTNPALSDRSPAAIVACIRALARCPGSKLTLPYRPWHHSWDQPASPHPTPLDEIQWVRDETGWTKHLPEALLWFAGFGMEAAFAILLGHYFAVPLRGTLLGASLIIIGLVSMSAPDLRLVRGTAVSAIIALLVLKFFVLSGFDPVVNSTPLLLVLSAIVAVPALVLFVSYLIIAMTVKVTRPVTRLTPADRARIDALVNAEDRNVHSIYNHVAGLSVLKPNGRLLRYARTKLALTFLNLFYRTYFVRGKLVSIPTIHFAQWNLIDGRRLLFLTNYDGGADSYLDDFFNSLALGVAFIWNDTVLFPGTSDPRQLKLWVRKGQTLAAVRYLAPVYHALTVGMINNNTFIRTRLLRGRGDRSARRWLCRFATNPTEPTTLARFVGWLADLGGIAG